MRLASGRSFFVGYSLAGAMVGMHNSCQGDGNVGGACRRRKEVRLLPGESDMTSRRRFVATLGALATARLPLPRPGKSAFTVSVLPADIPHTLAPPSQTPPPHSA